MADGPLPAGTVTFLFSDIEGSTRLLRQLGARYPVVLQAHRDLLRAACRSRGGVEFGTAGDSVTVAFRRASNAIAAALEGQRALQEDLRADGVDLRVRMGVHTGEVDLCDDGTDYVGLALHETARITAAGHGGQILVSDVTRRLVPDVDVVDLGEHHLKDLPEPVRLFQARAGGRLQRFPALRTVGRARHNLPVQRTRLVGREDELARVRGLVASHRLVTLTGVGGCGKTRLALAAAAELIDVFADGVYLVELAPVADPTRVAEVVAEAVGAQISTTGVTGSYEHAVAEFLAQREVLLVLDNCEHLLDAVAELVELLLTAGPSARVIATSREPLEVDGEQTHRVPSLAVAAIGDSAAPSSSAMELLVERAAEVSDDFALAQRDVPAAVEVCRRLDGLPLAIELAAAQLGHLSPNEVLDRLDRRFELLVGGGRRHQQRQQTLQAVMDWSWELLDAEEQRLLAGLAVFSGSWTLSAAEGVCSTLTETPTAVVLRSLVASSLVESLVTDTGRRYRLLETVRLFAQQKLVELHRAEQIRVAHRDWFVAWVRATPLERRLLSTSWSHDYDADFDNIAAAIEWSIDHGDAQAAAELVAAGTPLVFSDTSVRVAAQLFRWVPAVLEHDMPPATRALVHIAGSFASCLNDHRKLREWAEEGYAEACDADLAVARALSATWAALPVVVTSPDRAFELLDEARLVAQSTGSSYVRSFVDAWYLTARICRDLDATVDPATVELGDPDSAAGAIALPTLAMGAAWHGDEVAAEAYVDDFERRYPDMAHMVAGYRTIVAAIAGNVDRAEELARAAIVKADRFANVMWHAELVLVVAIIAYHRGQLTTCARYLEGLKRSVMYAPIFYVLRRRYATMAAESLGQEALRAAINSAASFDVEAVLDNELRQQQ